MALQSSSNLCLTIGSNGAQHPKWEFRRSHGRLAGSIGHFSLGGWFPLGHFFIPDREHKRAARFWGLPMFTTYLYKYGGLAKYGSSMNLNTQSFPCISGQETEPVGSTSGSFLHSPRTSKFLESKPSKRPRWTAFAGPKESCHFQKHLSHREAAQRGMSGFPITWLVLDHPSTSGLQPPEVAVSGLSGKRSSGERRCLGDAGSDRRAWAELARGFRGVWFGWWGVGWGVGCGGFV